MVPLYNVLRLGVDCSLEVSYSKPLSSYLAASCWFVLVNIPGKQFVSPEGIPLKRIEELKPSPILTQKFSSGQIMQYDNEFNLVQPTNSQSGVLGIKTEMWSSMAYLKMNANTCTLSTMRSHLISIPGWLCLSEMR